MTLVKVGKKGKCDYMEFTFESAMDAFVFYSHARDSYREDDLVIEMTEEGEE